MADALLEGSTDSRYQDWPAVLAALERLERAHAAKQVRQLGRWTPAEILDHLARFLQASLDGFGPERPPLPLRVFGRLIKPLALSDHPTPKGIKLKGPIGEVLLPTAEKEFASAMAEVRAQIARVHPDRRSNPYIAASPLLGPLSRAEWDKLHLKHFRHHLGYLRIGDGSREAAG